jgi:hypothetical protein
VPRTTLKRRAQEDDMASKLTKAVLAELEQLRAQVAAHEAALAPAFAPAPRPVPDAYEPRSWCGQPYPGPRGEPLLCRPNVQGPCCQGTRPGEHSAKKTSDPWVRDYEHGTEFVTEAREPGRRAGLRERSAREDELQRQAAVRVAAAPQVLHYSPVFCGAPGCRPATPCARCAGQQVKVMDKSGAQMGSGPQQSVIHADVPGYNTEAGRFAEVRAMAPAYSLGIGAIGTLPMEGAGQSLGRVN